MGAPSLTRCSNKPMPPRPAFARAAIILVILTLVATGAGAAGLLADPDRTRLGANETLTLRLIADGGLKGEPDLSPLERDFEILSRSTSSRTTIVNGDMTQSREWVLELAPRRTGELQIPALALAGERSQPVAIQVVPANQAVSGGGPRPLFLDAQADNPSPYVQEPLIYRVKIYYRDPPRRATLSDPQVDGATIEQRGDDLSYTEPVDGLRYTVIERRYLVIPQRSGPLKIGAPRLEALVNEGRPGARRSPFADLDELLGGRVFPGMAAMPDLGSGRRIVERGPDRTLEVRPQPTGSAEPWLPARSVQLADQWSPSPPRPRVGEPITRTLTITAQGATAAQLPTVDSGQPDGAQVYPEPPTTEDLAGGGPPAATKTLRLALVPTRAGTLTLPEIRLHWWDTVEDRQRVAVIPERILEVEPAAGSAPATPESALAPDGVPDAPHAASDQFSAEESSHARVGAIGSAQDEVPAPAGELPGAAAGGRFWPWLSLVLGVGWLLTLVALLWWRRRGLPIGGGLGPGEAESRLGSARSALDGLQSACTRNDPRAAREALIAWGRVIWPAQPPGGLSALAQRLGGGEATILLGALDRAIYAPAGAGEDAGWNGAAAWARLEPLLKVASSPRCCAEPDVLPTLYPRGV